jgi:hypothetical protein
MFRPFSRFLQIIIWIGLDLKPIQATLLMGIRNGNLAKFSIIGGFMNSYNTSYPGLISQSMKTLGSLRVPWKSLLNCFNASGILQRQIRVNPRNVAVARLEDVPLL